MRLFLMFAVATGFFISCAENSALNDLTITDPKLLKPVLTIENNSSPVYDIDMGRSTLTTYKLTITDKTGDRVRLDDGGVYLDNFKMSEKRTTFGKLLFYGLDESHISFRKGSNYTCRIRLEDGTDYESTVSTPGYESFQLPGTASLTQPLVIQAIGIVNGPKLNVTAQYYFKVAGRDTTVTRFYTAGASGNSITCSIPSTEYSGLPGVNKAYIDASLTTTGKLSSDFRSSEVYVSVNRSATIKIQ